MSPTAFIALFVGGIVGSGLLLRLSDVRLSRLSLPSAAYLSFMVFSYLGVLPLYFQWDPARVAEGVTDTDVIAEILVMNVISITAVVVGFLFARLMLGARDARTAHPVVAPQDDRGVGFAYVLVLLCAGVLALYVLYVPAIPLQIALQGNPAEAYVARSDATYSFGGPVKVHWYRMILEFFLPFLLYVIFASYLKWRRRVSLLGFVVVLAFTLAANLVNTLKGPAFEVLLGLFLTYVAVRLDYRMEVKRVLAFASFGFAVLVAIWSAIYSIDLASSARSVLSRVTSGQISPAYFYIEFAKEHELLWGRSFPDPGGLLGFEPFPLTHEIGLMMVPDGDPGVIGSAPSVYWAEALVNFGITGVMGFSFLMGVVLTVVDRVLSGLRNDSVNGALFSALCLHYMLLSGSGIGDYVVDVKLGLLLVLVMLLKLRWHDRDGARRGRLRSGTSRARPAEKDVCISLERVDEWPTGC